MTASIALTKYIDELLFSTAELKNISTGDKPLTPEDGTAVYRLRKVEESARIVNAIYEVMDRLTDEKKRFIQEHYWGNTKQSLSVSAERVNADLRTIKHWKKEVNLLIARRLGWL
ncbi:hypothetical protein [Planococcus soli]|uniref:hypothetical protein n=1 Tax=Planococcus soli TaxID=2666072 RepID=UPI00115DE478|nr:hypothetical protein [Planococcus soli]